MAKIILPPTQVNVGVQRGYFKRVNTLAKNAILQFSKQAVSVGHFGRKSDAIDAILSLRRSHEIPKDKLSEPVQWAVMKVMASNDKIMGNSIKDATSIKVDFPYDEFMNDAVQALISKNTEEVAKFVDYGVQKTSDLIIDSVTSGFDIQKLSKAFREIIGIKQRQAERLARNQIHYATTILEDARRESLGITKAIWMHSHAGRPPRPEHLAFDGKEYDIRKGAYLEGKWTKPGLEPNCRCLSQSVLEIL